VNTEFFEELIKNNNNNDKDNQNAISKRKNNINIEDNDDHLEYDDEMEEHVVVLSNNIETKEEKEIFVCYLQLIATEKEKNNKKEEIKLNGKNKVPYQEETKDKYKRHKNDVLNINDFEFVRLNCIKEEMIIHSFFLFY